MDYVAEELTNCSVSNTTNASNWTCSQPEFTYSLPWWRQLIWTVLFVAMATTASCGNLIVIWIVMSHKRMRTVTNYFIVNLSIADTMVSALNVTFNFVYMLNGHWPFGSIYCKVCSFISVISICGSVFTLVAISFDRYNAIMRPLRPRMSRPMTILVAVFIWMVAMALAVPQLLYFTITYNTEQDRIICLSVWPDGPTNESRAEFGYNVCFMLITYFVPMAMMTATYTAIGRELWGQQAIGEATEVQKESIKSKRRVVKMMIMVVLIFGICWLPYHVYFIVSNANPQIVYHPYVQEVYLSIYWLAMSNSMYNPMIYCFMNNRFRQGFLRVFRFFSRPCLCRQAHQAADAGLEVPAGAAVAVAAAGIQLKEFTTECRTNHHHHLSAVGRGRVKHLVRTRSNQNELFVDCHGVNENHGLQESAQ